MKIKLLYHPDYWSNLSSPFLASIYNKHFDIEAIDESESYDKSSCVIYTHWINNQWTAPWHEQGYKIVVDTLDNPVAIGFFITFGEYFNFIKLIFYFNHTHFNEDSC